MSGEEPPAIGPSPPPDPVDEGLFDESDFPTMCKHGVIEGEPCPDCENEPCLHGVPGLLPCDRCDQDRLDALLPGEPGHVRVSRAEIEAGAEEWISLTSNPSGPSEFVRYLELGPEDDVERAKGLCSLNLLELQDRMAAASGRNLDDYRSTGRLPLFVILAGIANGINQQPSRTFSWFKSRPRHFGTHAVLVAVKRRGKGVELEFVLETWHAAFREPADPELKHAGPRVVRVVRATLGGVFGSFRDRSEREGGSGAFVGGKVQEANGGVLVFPEFSSILGMCSGPMGREAAAAIAEYLATGRFEIAFVKGNRGYYDYGTWIAAIQPDAWPDVAVLGIGDRVVYASLRLLDSNDAAKRVEEDAEGHPLDPLALKVFAAKVQRIRRELSNPEVGFAKPQVVLDGIHKRLAALIRVPPTGGVMYGEDDRQRWDSVAFGYHLASGGNLAGQIVLPDPWTVPLLREVLEADAAVRHAFRVEPSEQLVSRVDALLGEERFSGTPEHPIPHTMNDISQYAAYTLGASPTKIRSVLRGYQDATGKRVSFEDRGILRRVGTGSTDPEFDAAQATAYSALMEKGQEGWSVSDLNQATAKARVAAEQQLGRKHRPGRPAELYIYVWPAARFAGRDPAASIVGKDV